MVAEVVKATGVVRVYYSQFYFPNLLYFNRADRTLQLQLLSDIAQAVGNLPSGTLYRVRDEVLRTLPRWMTGGIFDSILRMSVKP